MKILWLCSWYPNSADPYDGDFVERQAKSLALFEAVDVIHVVQNKHYLKKDSSLKKEERKIGNLNAAIYFLPLPKTGLKLIDAYLFNKRFNALYQQLIEEYISSNGQPDIVHVHVPVKSGLAAIFIHKKFAVPFVVTEHSSGYFENIPENYFSRNYYFRFVTKQTFNRAESVSSVSNWLIKHLQSLFKIKKTKLIRNVVDVTAFYPQQQDHEQKRFIHVSMMHPLKNVEGILESLAILKQKTEDWEMWFVGPASKENIELAERLGLERNVSWKGSLSYYSVAKAMRSADALVHFSRYENLPCVVNEALCCGLPVLSSDVGGIAELINESNGILISPGDSKALANAMNEFLAGKIQYNKQEIAIFAASQFSEQVIGKQIKDWYEQLLVKK